MKNELKYKTNENKNEKQYSVSKKLCHYTFFNNSGECWPIYKFF